MHTDDLREQKDGSITCSYVLHPVEILRTVSRAAAKTGAKSFAVAHNHPTPGAKWPSFKDLRHCEQTQDFAKAWGMRVVDYVIVEREGQVFSFRHHNILENPLNGIPFAEKALAHAYGEKVT